MISYVFPGQGSQFPGMGKDLFDTNADVKSMFLVLEPLERPTEMRVLYLVLGDNDATLMEKQGLHHQRVKHARVICNNHHRLREVRRFDRVP